ncbi:MAG: CaiB/BaiF CoA-transferase family protein [Roseiarcus sp.]|jgi:alpha-methylacyl-CoA racemase|uniref:CaiB/BaiF CoA transferase family protein n=1 Tax=Roseiarcus sp. TaxID=1969460 RepID=UPI003C26F05C
MGPLAGVKIIEMAGVGPAPFAGMLLADMGAEVVRIDRKPTAEVDAFDAIAGGLLDRGRRSIALDLKKAEAVAAALDLVAGADALIEGFRPGVMERLGLGPQACLARNPRLVFGRITGWGQEGPLAATAGHDIDYIALTGALHAIGAKDAPAPPLNLIGDFGGGAMFLAFGVACALIEARGSGRGQVVDAAMTDGASLLMAMTYSLKARGRWRAERQANLLDGGAPFYGVYRCADGKWVAVGALEPQFFAALVDKLGLESGAFADRWNPRAWPAIRARLEAAFAERSRDEWSALFAGSDACVAPVLDVAEAPRHPHNLARRTFVDVGGAPQPAPAPRFSRTPAEISRPSAAPGAEGEAILHEIGFSDERIEALKRVGAL